MFACDEEYFRHDKAAKIAKLRAQIDQIENGLQLESLQVQLRLEESRTYQQPMQERRFLVN